MTGDIRGIAGLEGREPVMAVLTLGRKALPGDVQDGLAKRPGIPILRERLFLMDPDPLPISGIQGGARRKHPRFVAFNAEHRYSGEQITNEERSNVTGRLVHATEEECWHYNLRSYTDPKEKKTPSRRPWCEGDGERARRIVWNASDEETVMDVPCPHEKCPFRQPRPNPRGRMPKPPLCKPHATLLFRIEWEGRAAEAGMPTGTVKWTTQSWHSIRNVLGFFRRIHDAAASLGMAPGSYSLLGLKFELSVQPRTSSKDEGRRFPVVRVVGTDDPLLFLLGDAERRQRLESQRRPVTLLTGSVERSARTEHIDHEQNQPGLHTDVIEPEVTDG